MAKKPIAREPLVDPMAGVTSGFAGLVAAWQSGSKIARALVVICVASGLAAVIVFTIGRIWIDPDLRFPVYELLTAVAGIVAAGANAYKRLSDREARNRRIARLEERAESQPELPQASWDLAREKLESYLDRNLSQVSGIFWPTLIVMFFGFGLILYGVWLSLHNPTTLTSAALASISGIVVQFIAATFLIIYKSTMEQAHKYVTVLERINAVGMSIQILAGIEGDNAAIRNAARAEISRDLLKMYALPSKVRSNRANHDREDTDP